MELNEDITAGSHLSVWTASVKPIRYSTLEKSEKTDVVIVGGGIAGVTTAYNLSLQGKKVILLEDGFIGSGESGRTTAHVVTCLDDRYYNLEHLHGTDGAKMAAESHAAAIEFVESAVEREKINCDFSRLAGYLFRHPSDDKDVLKKEYDAAIRAGVKVERLEETPGIRGEGECLYFHGQAQFHILKYLKGLCEAIISRGGKIYTQTHADKIDANGVTTDRGYRVDAEHIVVATNSPVNDLRKIHTKQTAYRTYVIGAKIKKGSVLPALWWDTGDFEADSRYPPYHYVRTQRLSDTHDVLIVGGEDHPTGIKTEITEEERYHHLELWTKERFDTEGIIYRWSGQVLETMDSLAFIGRNPGDADNIYIITGDSGNGMTHATIGAMMITNMILGVPDRWEKLYDPSRSRILKTVGQYVHDGFAAVKKFLKDRPQDDKVSAISKIKKGDAEVLQLKGEKYGIHRDDNGSLHIVSAVCTHLQCTVRWNGGEKTWDCPCHGSRFSYEGKVMNGPANADLAYHLSGKEDEKE
ncbi:MAG: FAD-dependent oxidoreductase [Bacteroidia bacterium]